MEISNSINTAIAKRRWIRRLNLFRTPQSLWINYKGLRFYINPKDWKGPSYHVISWGIESYERENIQFVTDFLFKSDNPCVFVDVGANIGIYPFLTSISFPQTRIHAFEPEPDSFDCLSKNLRSEKFPFARFYKQGLSDRKGKITLFRDGANAGGHSVFEQSILNEANQIVDQIEIDMTTIDDFVVEKKIKTVDLIKLDVQRHENQVLSGAKKLLTNTRPVILMECYFEDLFSNHFPLTEHFSHLNYEVYDPKNKRLYRLDKSDLIELAKSGQDFCDLVFYPVEKKDMIEAIIDNRL